MEGIKDYWHNCSGHRELAVICLLCYSGTIFEQKNNEPTHPSSETPLNLVHGISQALALQLLFCVGITFCTFLNENLAACLSCEVQAGERRFLSRGLMRALLSEALWFLKVSCGSLPERLMLLVWSWLWIGATALEIKYSTACYQSPEQSPVSRCCSFTQTASQKQFHWQEESASSVQLECFNEVSHTSQAEDQLMQGKARENGDILKGWCAVLCLGRGDRSVGLMPFGAT